MWEAFHSPDREQTGRLFMAVRTTGIYCRPGCPARQPKRENVRFFASAAAAERIGFRACKRCRPNLIQPDPRVQLVEDVCRYLDEHFEDDVRIGRVAEALAVSPQSIHRAFREVIGLTPSKYARHRRLEGLRHELRNGDEVSRAIYGAGFSSPSRVYEDGANGLGMTPATYRKGGTDQRIAVAVGQSPFGVIGVASTERGVCAVRLGDSPDAVLSEIRGEFSQADIELDPNSDIINRIVAHIVDGSAIDELALDIRGTVFQRRVWEELRRIPRGEHRSYGQVAVGIGSPTAVRAVANACAANPVALVTPCHRVVRSDGGAGGYRWGDDRKRAILALEREV
jgi:AraC family transcriptional regulator of adaptative response/methylated-DNA-[protein]-cysteine methyltransferase